MATPLETVAPEHITKFCRRWKVTELAVFGSVLRADFRSDSDVDLLVSFDEGADWSLFDLVTMQHELADMFGRSVDIVEQSALRNPYRRRAILNTKRILYAAPGGFDSRYAHSSIR